MKGWYILNRDGEAVPCDDLDIIETFLKDINARRVAFDSFGEVEVSTVFLALDHGFGAYPLPMLWETMIFGGEHDGYQCRYMSRTDALAGHQKAVELVKKNLSIRKFKFAQ